MAGMMRVARGRARVGSLTAIALLAGCATATQQVPEPIAPQQVAAVAERISEPVINADHAAFAGLRQRLKVLNESGIAIDNYWLCKARAWLDMAFDEYTDNDRGPVVDAAFKEALTIIKALEAKTTPASTETPVIAGARRVREDLWQFAAEFKANDGLSRKACAACNLAELEVHTVWIGHEYASLGWRLAEPEVQMAEDLLRRVQAQVGRGCPGPVLTAPTPLPGLTVPTAAPQCPSLPTQQCARLLELVPDRVHFAFNSSKLSRSTRAVLTRVAQALAANPSVRLTLVGQADAKGTPAANQLIAKKRAEAVKAQLLLMGVEASRIQLTARGAVAAEPNRDELHGRALVRTVQMIFTGADGIQIVTQDSDVQADR